MIIWKCTVVSSIPAAKHSTCEKEKTSGHTHTHTHTHTHIEREKGECTRERERARERERKRERERERKRESARGGTDEENKSEKVGAISTPDPCTYAHPTHHTGRADG